MEIDVACRVKNLEQANLCINRCCIAEMLLKGAKRVSVYWERRIASILPFVIEYPLKSLGIRRILCRPFLIDSLVFPGPSRKLTLGRNATKTNCPILRTQTYYLTQAAIQIFAEITANPQSRARIQPAYTQGRQSCVAGFIGNTAN